MQSLSNFKSWPMLIALQTTTSAIWTLSLCIEAIHNNISPFSKKEDMFAAPGKHSPWKYFPSSKKKSLNILLIAHIQTSSYKTALTNKSSVNMGNIKLTSWTLISYTVFFMNCWEILFSSLTEMVRNSRHNQPSLEVKWEPVIYLIHLKKKKRTMLAMTREKNCCSFCYKNYVFAFIYRLLVTITTFKGISKVYYLHYQSLWVNHPYPFDSCIFRHPFFFHSHNN